MRRHSAWLLILALALAAGCGARKNPDAEGEGESSSSSSGSKDAGPQEPLDVKAGAVAWDPAKGTATVKGKVSFQGPPPKRRALDMGSDPGCQSLHASPVMDESVVVGTGGALGNVFVWVQSGLAGWRFPVPTEPAVLAQKGCVYLPHVVGMQAGQVLAIRNEDGVTHNVHSSAEKNMGFNFSQKKGKDETRVFRRAEVPVRFKCDLHGWMSAYVCVSLHPFFRVTNGEGAFELKGLPPGKYTIEAWHETLGRQTAEVTLADKESKEIAFTFKAR